MFEGLSPKRWSGEGCAAPSPPQPLNRDRDLSSFRSNPLAPDEKASRGGRAKLPRALVDPGQPAKHRPSPSISSSDANKLSKFLSAHCNGRTHKQKSGRGTAEYAGYTSYVIVVGLHCRYQLDRTGDAHADSVEIIENWIALCAGVPRTSL